MVVNEAAISVRPLVEISHGWQAKVSKIMPQFRKVFLAQHLRFSLIGTTRHRATDFTTFAVCSPSAFPASRSGGRLR